MIDMLAPLTVSSMSPNMTLLWERSVAWLADHLRYFKPSYHLKKLDTTDEECLPATAELAQLCYTARQSPLVAWPASLTAALQQMESIAADEWLWSITNQAPRELEYFLLVVRALEHCDRSVVNYRTFVQMRIDQQHVLHSERIPHRVLLLRALFDDMGFEHSLPSVTELYGSTLLVDDSYLPLVCQPEVKQSYWTVLALRMLEQQGNVLPPNQHQRLVAFLQTLLKMAIRGRDPIALATALANCYLMESLPLQLDHLAWQRLVDLVLNETDQPADFAFTYPKHLAIMSAALLSLTYKGV